MWCPAPGLDTPPSLALVQPPVESLEHSRAATQLQLSPPQAPALELQDGFSNQSFRSKQFNTIKAVRGPVTLLLLLPRCEQQQLPQADPCLFRLEPPQAPPLELEDCGQKTRSRIRNICEPEAVKSLEPILLHPFREEADREYCECLSLLNKGVNEISRNTIHNLGRRLLALVNGHSTEVKMLGCEVK